MESIPHYEPFASEYAERLCSWKGLTVVNPFDGEIINILDHDFGSTFEGKLIETKIVELLGN